MIKNKIIKELVVDGILKAHLLEEGIIEIIWDSEIDEIEVLHLKEMQRLVGILGNKKKMPLLFNTPDFINVSPEAGKFAVTKEGTLFSKAIGVILDNSAKKLLMNFFVIMNKPTVPTKGFSERKKAIEWLKHQI
ncbi:MAG: hypothetical protein AB7O73_05820 [Bacteroidia bacterium]